MKKTNTFFKNASGIFIFFLLLTGISSCSKNGDNDNNDGAKGKSIRITISVSPVEDQGDFVGFALAGAGSDINENSIWKVNGTIQNSQKAISLGKNDFNKGVGTYVIESAVPITNATSSIDLINHGADMNYSFKIEINGKVTVEETNKKLSGDNTSFTKHYTL